MATYKVLQDIEAEDKFVGPLTLKQFIFLGVTALCIYISFFAWSKGAWFVGLMLSPIIIIGGFLGFPWGRDQPTEVWLLAKLRFFLKPRKRIWDQTGMSELVKITVPKKVIENFSNNLTQTEVKSRLQALAETIDSRGWAVKNVNINMSTQPAFAGAGASTDRLVDASTLPQISTMAAPQISESDDIFDNAHASQITSQIAQSAQAHKDNIRQTTQRAAAPQQDTTPAPDFWFMNQPDPSSIPKGQAAFVPQSVRPHSSNNGILIGKQPEDVSPEAQAALLEKVHHKKAEPDANFSYRRKVIPDSQKPATKPAAPPLTNTGNPAILDLARDNNRNVSSLAREAERIDKRQDLPDDEIVISLH